MVFLPSWPSFVIQGSLLVVTLAVIVYLALDKRHIVVVPAPPPPPRADGTVLPANPADDLTLTKLDPHRVIVPLLWLLFVQQIAHFLDLMQATQGENVTSYLSGALMVVLFTHLLFVGLRGFYFNVRSVATPPDGGRVRVPGSAACSLTRSPWAASVVMIDLARADLGDGDALRVHHSILLAGGADAIAVDSGSVGAVHLLLYPGGDPHLRRQRGQRRHRAVRRAVHPPPAAAP